MGFKTPFLPENTLGSLNNFGFYKIQRQTKTVIIEMLTNFFNAINSIYQLQMPDLIGIQNAEEAQKIFIQRDFSAQQRRIPAILVAIKNSMERKMYIGGDNLSYFEIDETSTGKTAVEVYHGAADIGLALIVIAQSPDERMQFAELINMCFTHYYRWQYFYSTGDGTMFCIVPSTSQLDFGSETEVTDVSPDSLLYLLDISMKSFVEYTFRDLDIMGILKEYNITEESGPISD